VLAAAKPVRTVRWLFFFAGPQPKEFRNHICSQCESRRQSAGSATNVDEGISLLESYSPPTPSLFASSQPIPSAKSFQAAVVAHKMWLC
jgi:hypothetical protein